MYALMMGEGCSLSFGLQLLLSRQGLKERAALLIEYKADVNMWDDLAIRKAIDNVALLVEHKADVHAYHDHALRWASGTGKKEIFIQKMDVPFNWQVCMVIVK
jgi:hypothetical protein